MLLSKFKSFTALSLMTVLLMSSAAGVYAAEDSSFESAGEATANIVSGWNLGNTLDSYGTWIDKNGGTKAYETAWGNVETTQEIIDSVRDQGFNAIRISVTWSQHIDSKGNILEKIELPCKRVSCCAFGGKGLDELYITTAAKAP